MAHFAKVENGVVTQVIVAEEDFIATQPGTWVQTSYNTKGGQYTKGDKNKDKQKDKDARERKNFASVGGTYDATDDAFYPPQPYPSWKIDKPTGTWVAPKQMPEDGNTYEWDEGAKDWVIIN